MAVLSVVLFMGYETGRRDPVDPFIYSSEEELAGVDGLLKCGACRSRVNELSRHCLICDKCVVDFDHHCQWLNNCIGEKNYRTFRWLIASTALLVCLQLVVSTILFLTYFHDMDMLRQDLTKASLLIDDKAYMGLVCFNALFSIPALLLVAHLVGFHMFLCESEHMIPTHPCTLNHCFSFSIPRLNYI